MKKHTIIIILLLLSLGLASCEQSSKKNDDINNSLNNEDSLEIPNLEEQQNDVESVPENNETEIPQENNKPADKPQEEANKPADKPQEDTNKPGDNSIENNKPKPNPILKDAITVYNESVARMQRCIYEVKGTGISTNDKSSDPLYIYETLQHSKEEVYFEKISNGLPVNVVFTKIGVSFAEKAYISGNTGRRQSASTKNPWTPFDGNNWKNSYPVVNNYSSPINKAPSEILTEFGKQGDNYLNFNIDYDTVKNENLKYKKNSQGLYLLEFDLVLDKGINSKSVKGYSNQVSTMSGKELASIEKIKITIILDKYLRVLKYKSHEEYTVTTLSTKVKNDLTYVFTYNDQLKVTKF